MAKLGAKVTVLDISDVQLELAKKNLSESGVIGRIDRFIRADITDLSIFADASFDSVVCFGGALSYVCEQRQPAVNEISRITGPGGTILVSVMSRLGAVLGVVAVPEMGMLNNPWKNVSGIPRFFRI